MMHAPLTRADREIAIEDFGRSRVTEAISRLRARHGRFGLGILTADALDELLAMLEADAELQDRLNAANRAISAEQVM